MSFDLVNLSSFVIAFAVIAGLTVLITVAASIDFLSRNRKVRVARHESIPTYYGNLLGAH